MRPSQAWPNCELGALVIGADAFFKSRREQLAALALAIGAPISQYRESVAAGGLMSYGAHHYRTRFVWSAPTPAGFSRARSRPTCRSDSRPNLSWSST